MLRFGRFVDWFFRYIIQCYSLSQTEIRAATFYVRLARKAKNWQRMSSAFSLFSSCRQIGKVSAKHIKIQMYPKWIFRLIWTNKYCAHKKETFLCLWWLKGQRHDWGCLFKISFFPKLLYISSMNPSQNRTTIFKLIVHGIELHAVFEERENKQKNAKF